MSADRQLWQSRICLLHGYDAGIQRSWRYDYSDHRELLRVLALRDPAGLCAREAVWLEVEWSFLFHCDCRVGDGGGERDLVQAGQVEDEEDLTRHKQHHVSQKPHPVSAKNAETRVGHPRGIR